MIRFGPAGIPLSCKGRTLKDGIEDVHNLSLSALEIQMVRAGAYPRPAEDEEVGLTIRDVEEDFVIEILRDGEPISDPEEPIEEEDDLLFMPSPVANTFGDLAGIGHMAQRLDVRLSIHTPYYMDLSGTDEELTYSCIDSIRHAGLILDALDGDIVVTSLGIYDENRPREEVEEQIYGNMGAIVDWWKGSGLKPRLGVEITGQQDVFGSLEQVLDLCTDVGDITPVINFSHQHSRTNGGLLETEDFLNLIEQVAPYCKGGIHTAFAGVEYTDGNETRLTPIKKGDLKFEPLAEALQEIRPDCTVISTSPLLEHDAMYMRIIQERVLTKKAAKDLKERRKSESAAASGE
ncbi:MAG: TIM barrel protein [Thermoplasmata archaeon]|nr:TIM barrel protein [Thermoplasmata archaeon]